MKNRTIYRFMAFLFAASFIFTSCTKKAEEVKLDPTLSTSQTINITSASATVIGFVIAEGDGFTEKGVCYNTAANPTIENSKVVYSDEKSTATFNVSLSGLDYATLYYARAYATGASGTVYGEEVTFTTLPVAPMLSTNDITDITGNSATGGGNVTGSGGADVTARGICYSVNEIPTIEDGKTVDADGLGEFTSALNGLLGNTVYYVRAYATNSAGTGYGPQVSFTTLVDLPQVSTALAYDITKVSAVSGGDVTYDGGGDITARGIVWSLVTDPTLSDNVIDGGTGTGEFVSNLENLSSNTNYHVRAFATNSAGTSYGEDVLFKTLADITKMWVVGAYNGWDNSDNAQYIESTVTGDGTAEGYVYITGNQFKLVTDHSWSDGATFGDDGSGNLTNPGDNINVAEDGYYLIKANLETMTYSATKTVWGIIGDATTGGWGAQTNMTYNATDLTFNLVSHMTDGGSFKFRGTDDWSINYGSDNNDGNLNAGGANIPVDVESDYSITLDLSHPNAYTYSANRWGLIGDATPGGWSDDTNMNWDATNGVFTITLDLVSSGSFKIRANDDWAINYGGDLNALEAGGANINIDSDGNYTVTFDPWGLTATVTKN